ncbi:MAG: hypothetical protein WCW64_10925 [Phycisphaerae bacterium]
MGINNTIANLDFTDVVLEETEDIPPRSSKNKGWQRMAFCGASIL